MATKRPTALQAFDVAARTGSTYPAQFGKDVDGRSKRVLGDLFGLTNYGVNLVTLAPGAWSAQRHWHTSEDEFVYVVSGELTLVTDEGENTLTAGAIAGFPAGEQNGHHLVNKSTAEASYLEIGDRRGDDECYYPDIDLQLVSNGRGGRHFTRRDGEPYPQGE